MIEALRKVFHRSEPQASPSPCRACSVCGCRLDEPGWTRCPRCGQELPVRSPCDACGRCCASEGSKTPRS